MNKTSDVSVPDGQEWMGALQSQILDPCCAATTAFIRDDPELSTQFACLGTVLSLTDRLSSCGWGCREQDHTVHYVVGRACGHASAAWILVRHGHYDAALSLVRGIAEIANLLALFDADRAALHRWKEGDDPTRDREFGPVKVRLALEKVGSAVPVSQHVYKVLSQHAAHVTPHTRPEVYSLTDRPLASGTFQEDGIRTGVNFLSYVYGRLAVAAAKVLWAPEKALATVVSSAQILISWTTDG